ncbi:uncharacterized protein LOC122391520 [Amphibalanus amphitrite]|uniref:uncharacterized protein LOC122379093 n=1 Tax=Amphibalanus amphitrite TaxID=1232801 RepID=UPI001C9197BD|nr:uncharacterized protein LOC122379093 [Amphibalanus amphitrite]XP_043241464.1 uncharacterized protein LOC122391520 [Amphibalanus amphitrite]
MADPSRDSGGVEAAAARSLRRGSSVSELVRSYDDGAGKRDRSESGDSVTAPMGKRRPLDPSPRKGEVKELIEDAVEGIESRLSLFISKELHEFKASLQTKFDALHARIKDLEEHVNEKDLEIERMSTELKETREEMKKLSERSENAEMNSRIPCLILSGRAMAPHRNPSLAAPLRPAAGRAPGGTDSAGPSEERAAGGAALGGGGGGGAGGVGGARSGEGTSEEDVNQLVIRVLQSRFPGLGISVSDIDRAHRLPGPNHRVIVRFVHSGSGSIRERLMTRRMELRGSNDLYINESLTALKSQIQRSLLEAKKAKKIYTVFTRRRSRLVHRL